MRISSIFVVSLSVAACKQAGRNADTTNAVAAGAPIVADARIGTPNPPGAEGEWVMPARDYASSRYSTLAQITSANAKNLRAAWTFSTGVLRGHEGQPLVVNKTMYVVTPYPNVAYAIDLTQPGVLRCRQSRCGVRRGQARL
jgi:glucose dehydrogenase